MVQPLTHVARQNPDMAIDTDGVIDIDDAEYADLIIGQRVNKPGPSTWWQQQGQRGRPLVFELDDDLWNVHPSSPAYRVWSDPAVLARLTDNVRAASAVTVSTDYLGDLVRELNPNVTVLPNCIDADLLGYDRPRRDKLTIGWAGSPTHLMDFTEVADPLKRYLRKYPAVDMHFIGADYSQLVGRASRITNWVASTDAYHRVIDFDIGIAPLKDDRFNWSKSPVKALEYAALGIPIVASDVGPYRDFVQHGVTGFLCRFEHEWFKYLRILTEDAALRESMGEAARAQAVEHTIQRNAHRWADVYRAVLA